MQELIEGCVAVRLLASGKEFIARARREELAMNWKGAAFCYVNAARQLGNLPGQTELRAKALGRAGLCFERNGDLKLAARCYQDSWRLCIWLGEKAARDCMWRKGKIMQQKIYPRRHYVDVRTVSAQAEGQAEVGMQGRDDAGSGCEVSELRQDSGAAEMVDGQVRAHGDYYGCRHGVGGAADV